MFVSRNVGLWYLKKDGSFVKAESKDVDNYAITYDAGKGGSRLKDGTIPIATNKIEKTNKELSRLFIIACDKPLLA